MESIVCRVFFSFPFSTTDHVTEVFRLKLLVATDVAARGLDIKGVGSPKEEKNGHQKLMTLLATSLQKQGFNIRPYKGKPYLCGG